MEEQLLLKNFNSPLKLVSKIKSNVFLIETENKEKRILKTRRKKKLNFLDRIRFRNEKRFYTYVKRFSDSGLKVPITYSGESGQLLLMEYLERDPDLPVDSLEFVQAYLQFQHLNLPEEVSLDFQNQLFRGFTYRICGVSVITLPKKVKFSTCLRIIALYSKLWVKTNPLENKYWFHGDLNKRNYFINRKNRELYFIDFENIFYTRRWPFAEIISKSFSFKDGKIDFDIELFRTYFSGIEEDSELKKISLKSQFRFALLQNSIHKIAQTKVVEKRKQYTLLLEITLDKKAFKNWFSENVKRKLRPMTLKTKRMDAAANF